MGSYKTDALTYFDHKHSCVNSTWYPCCLFLQEQYLRKICSFLNWLTTLKRRRRLNFRINDHLDFVIIVRQNHLSQALCYQKLLPLWIQKYVNWRTWQTLYPALILVLDFIMLFDLYIVIFYIKLLNIFPFKLRSKKYWFCPHQSVNLAYYPQTGYIYKKNPHSTVFQFHEYLFVNREGMNRQNKEENDICQFVASDWHIIKNKSSPKLEPCTPQEINAGWEKLIPLLSRDDLMDR